MELEPALAKVRNAGLETNTLVKRNEKYVNSILSYRSISSLVRGSLKSRLGFNIIYLLLQLVYYVNAHLLAPSEETTAP